MTAKKSTFALIVLLIILFLSACGTSNRLDSSYAFSEYAGMKKTNSNLKQVHQQLKSTQYEDEKLVGFINKSLVIDLYKIYSCLKCADVMQDVQIKERIRSNTTSLKTIDMSAASFLDLMYYIDICHELQIIPEKDPIVYLSKYYNAEDKLYFPFSAADDINTKLIATRMCALVCKNELPHREEIIQTIDNLLFDGRFFSSGEDTFYNSGGALITCAAVFEIHSLDRTEISKWFLYWQKINEAETIKSFPEAIQYSSFYEVARCIDPSYDNRKLQYFYASINEDLLTDKLDPLMIYSILVNAGPLDNDRANTVLTAFLQEQTADALQMSQQLDFSETAAGYILAEMTGFSLDSHKIQNYLSEAWSDEGRDSDNMRIKKLYDILYVSVLYDLPAVLLPDADIQLTINRILPNLLRQEDVQGSLISVRRILEIVSFLQAKQRNVSLSGQQISSIKQVLKQAVKDNQLLSTYSFIDIWTADRVLGTRFIHDKLFFSLCESLSEDGGYKAYVAADSADIWTSLRIVTCYRFTEKDYNIAEIEAFLHRLEPGAGIYAFNEKDGSKSLYTLQTILYGTMLANMNSEE